MNVTPEIASAWTEALLNPDSNVREPALGQVVAHTTELDKARLLVPLAAAAAVAPGDSDSLPLWLDRLGRPDVEEVLLDAMDDPSARAAALTFALRHGAGLQGGVQSFLLGELDVLDADEPNDAAALDVALKVLTASAPETMLDMAGVCAQATVDWLRQQPATRTRPLLSHYAERLAPHLSAETLPEPAEAHALLILEILAEPLAEPLMELLAERMDSSPWSIASVLARLCVGIGLSMSQNDEPAAPTPEPVERLDAEEVRGLLDFHQIPYNDLDGGSWKATLRYLDTFEQRQSAPLFVGLTGRRLVMRLTLQSAPKDAQALLRQNHYSGLARFTFDSKTQLNIVAELPRDGFQPTAFEQTIEDLRSAIEWLSSQLG